jgi:hypothetical protein
LQHFRKTAHVSPEAHRFRGLFAFQGVVVLPPAKDGRRAVTAVEAAAEFEKAPSTIRCWALRYGAVQLKKVGKRVYYDLADLSVIDRELRHGHDVPATPEERAAIRAICPLWAAERQAAQQAAA